MTLSDIPSIVISLRVIFGSVTMAFASIAILRLISQYRQFRYSQSIYSIGLVSSVFLDAFLRTVALTIFPNRPLIVTPNSIFFLTSQLLEAAGIMFFTMYLIGILNGFWDRRPPASGDQTLPGRGLHA